MGMFASKAASKAQDANKETKTEAKEIMNVSLLSAQNGELESIW